MSIDRRGFLAALLASSIARPAAASTFPSGPVTMVAPYPPGGGVDILVRTFSDALAKELGQPVVIDNRPGANGIIGTSVVARAQPDGQTLLVANVGPSAISQALYRKLPYHCIDSFSPIIQIGFTNHVLAVTPSLPVKNVQELIALAKQKPGELTFGSTGVGGSPHLAGELFKLLAGVDLLHVPYKGATPSNTDLMGGQISMAFNTLPPLLPLIENGQVRALAVTAAKRSAMLPDVPTIAESGVANYDVSTWYGISGPAGLPPELVARLNGLLAKILQQEAIRERLTQQGYEMSFGSAEEFKAMIKNDVARWVDVVRAANLKPIE